MTKLRPPRRPSAPLLSRRPVSPPARYILSLADQFADEDSGEEAAPAQKPTKAAPKKAAPKKAAPKKAAAAAAKKGKKGKKAASPEEDGEEAEEEEIAYDRSDAADAGAGQEDEMGT